MGAQPADDNFRLNSFLVCVCANGCHWAWCIIHGSKKKKPSAAELIFEVIFLFGTFFVSATVIIIYFGAVIYGAAIFILAIIYSIIGELILKFNQSTRNDSIKSLARAKNKAESLEAEIQEIYVMNPDVRRSKDGSFDARTKKGRLLNEKVNSLAHSLKSIETCIQDHTRSVLRYDRIFEFGIFLRYSILFYLITLAAFAYLELNMTSRWPPVAATIISLLGGYAVKARLQSRERDPQKPLKYNQFITATLIVVSIYVYVEYRSVVSFGDSRLVQSTQPDNELVDSDKVHTNA